MAFPGTAGTPRKVLVAGVPFDVVADCNPNSNFSEWKTESQATSGLPIQKATRQACYIKGIDLKATPSEAATLATLAESPISIPLVVVYANASSASGIGRIALGDHEGANNKITVDFLFDIKPVVVG
jgi:hypothetical protein